MTLDIMMIIEPKLQDIVTFVWSENLRAKKEKVNFWDTYTKAKNMLKPLVGDYAENELLAERGFYEAWIEFIQNLSPNTLNPRQHI